MTMRKLSEDEKLDILPEPELSKLAFECLVENLGYFNATEYVINIKNRAKTEKNQNYKEWSEEYFGKMTDEEFMEDLQDYIKNHPHE